MIINPAALEAALRPITSEHIRNIVTTAIHTYIDSLTNDDPAKGPSVLENGRIRIDLSTKTVTVGGCPLSVTPKELSLLCFFIEHKGRTISVREILKSVWGPAHVENVQYLRVYIRQIRQKLARYQIDYIITQPRLGYRMEAVSAEAVAA